MQMHIPTRQHLLSAVLMLAPALAWASGDSGTGAVGEMEVSGGQFLLILGGAVVVGLALWLVVKLINK